MPELSRSAFLRTHSPLTCPHSPRCLPAVDLLRRLGEPDDAPWRWVHPGPIDPHRTPLTLHTRAVLRKNGGGGGAQERDERPPRLIATPAVWRGHAGYHLDLFGVTEPRPFLARRLPELGPEFSRFWVLYAVAWLHGDGPAAEWEVVPGAATARTRFLFPGESQPSVWLDEARRCSDLLLGRASRPGRKSRLADPAWLALGEQAERRLASSPGLTMGELAADLHLDVRNLRTCLADYRRERDARTVTGLR
jgi:hypothetical protein